MIESHNSKPEKTFTMGLNQYSDWSDEEFGRLNGYKYSGQKQVSQAVVKKIPNDDDTRDW